MSNIVPFGGGVGGSSKFGGGGLQVITGSTGNNGTSYGSGGSGAAATAGATSYNGGSGSAGVIRVWEYA